MIILHDDIQKNLRLSTFNTIFKIVLGLYIPPDIYSAAGAHYPMISTATQTSKSAFDAFIHGFYF